jgi:hypothetical protein
MTTYKSLFFTLINNKHYVEGILGIKYVSILSVMFVSDILLADEQLAI